MMFVPYLYLLAAVCFIIALKGLSSPRYARLGNFVGAGGAVLAVLGAFIGTGWRNVVPVLAALAVGAAIGAWAAKSVAMTGMPQMVGLLNGVGGGAGAIVATLEIGPSTPAGPLAMGAFSVFIGSVTLSGSLTTYAKLQDLMTARPVIFPGMPIVAAAVMVAMLAGAVWTGTSGNLLGAAVVALTSLVLGVFLVLPVGGADVPIVISLLNAFSGITVAATGYVLGDTLLIVAGTLVGASGILLSQLMANAMGRSVPAILFGAFAGGSTLGATTETDRPVRSSSPEDVAILLNYARKVIVVPGYGLAVAQAQHAIRDLATVLEGNGVDVAYAIHPVAGRMPGHMNVLLAEADVPYDQLKEMDAINPDFKSTDVVLVVGANDVVNPAARTSPGSPIYGMPIIAADEANAIVFLKRSMRPGFAGIENELLHDPKTTLLFGDAKDSLTSLVAAVKAM